MPVSKLTLTDALSKLQALGPAQVVLGNGAATAKLLGALAFEARGEQVVLRVGCACEVGIARDRIRHAVLSEKEIDGQRAAHAQLFDGNYDKVVALVFPQGLSAARALVTQLDGNDFEID